MIMKKNKPHIRSYVNLQGIFLMFIGLLFASSTMAQMAEQDSIHANPDSMATSSVADSLLIRPHTIQELEDSISILQDRINKLELQQLDFIKQIAFADTCIVRQCNNALNAPYDEKRVRNALSAFNRISSSAYRQQMLPLCQLLTDYGQHYRTIMDILRRADADRNMRNPFGGKETAEAYINEIRQTDYYRNVIQAEWIIPFMNSLIEKAINRLKSNNPGERQTTNLKELLNP